MSSVTKQDKNRWGSSFKDRKNSYDDDSDIEIFVRNHVKKIESLKKYIIEKIGSDAKGYFWTIKPEGKYGPDLGLYDSDKNLILILDLERWSQWGEDWPSYYKYLHFLGRKDHFLERDIPFLMVYLSHDRDKLIILEKEELLKYKTKEKFFRHKKKFDRVKECKMKSGFIFGKKLSHTEKSNFKLYGE